MARKPRKTVAPTTNATTKGTLNGRPVSSPASTGGAGTFFEQHVDAYWLAQLLVQSIPPILLDCAVIEVHLQTEHLGWHTDDFLIACQNGSGNCRRLAGQVKRAFTVSATNDECNKAVQDFWKDFRKPEQFSPTADRFLLVTQRGTNTLLEHFSGLLDCARAARDGAEFEHRLSTPGFISAKAVQYCEEIRTIIGETEGGNFSASEIWPFLRVLHVLSLDLDTTTGQTEAMIKTLLAHTTDDQDGLGAAEASWNALLREVGAGMHDARSFRRDDLPEAIRRRHMLLGGSEHRALLALKHHSSLILDGIRSTFGKDLHLRRERLVQQVLEQLESTQVVLISGAAGSGKSSIAKDVVDIFAADHFVFSFRAEEFAHPHLDETLQRNQIPASGTMLGAILAAQGRKVLLVESVERLLEASTRDAFSDLMTLIARDKSWRLMLTCRDYSTDLVRTGLLEARRIGHSVVTISPLADEELGEVRAAHPKLDRPLANAGLRQLLRNPYILDKALQISWAEGRSLPRGEREFRALFWREVVRADHRPAGGMPRQRENAFVQIALRRARALTLYATCGDLNPQVVVHLRYDSLIVSSEQSEVLVAPAHDVLEDWAILEWIDEQYVTQEGSIRELAAAIGMYPAVRRTYRKWVAELGERHPGGADELFQASLHDGDLPTQFRDDTLIALLRSSASVAFLERHSSKLFVNEKQLLRRVIHLLRVACVTTPSWWETTTGHPTLFHAPDGQAWACVLQLVQEHLGEFTQADYPLLLGLIEDWGHAVSWQTPYPEGAEAVAAVAHWLLPKFDHYQFEDQQKRTLRILANIPNADRERFAAIVLNRHTEEKRNRTAEGLEELIFQGLEGCQPPAICRASSCLPRVTICFATKLTFRKNGDIRIRSQK